MLKAEKELVWQDRDQIFGLQDSGGIISMDLSKIKTVKTWSTPTCVRELQQFIGLASSQNEFIKGFTSMAAPLTNLQNAKQEWLWKDVHDRSFEKLKTD